MMGSDVNQLIDSGDPAYSTYRGLREKTEEKIKQVEKDYSKRYEEIQKIEDMGY